MFEKASFSENKVLAYEISLQRCEGEFRDLEDIKILFDYNGSVNNTTATGDIPYRILSETGDIVIDNKETKSISGKDLFVVEDPLRAHSEVEAIDIPGHKSLIIEFDLSHFEFFSLNDDTTMLSTFLKIGNSREVQIDINLIP